MNITSNKERFYQIANTLNLKIKFKNESLLMKVIGTILFFNKSFITSFIITLGSTVYFPSAEFLEQRTYDSLPVLFHEKRHELDSEKNKLFPLFYLLPQLLAPISLVLCFFSFWLGVSLFILFLLPLPAYWRKKYELRGYQMSLFVTYELCRENNLNVEATLAYLNRLIDSTDKLFTGPSYYFMWVFGVKQELRETVNKILSDDILKDDPIYAEVRELLISTRIHN
jgi:hypothetical protein